MKLKNLIIRTATIQDKDELAALIKAVDWPGKAFMRDFRDMWSNANSKPCFLVATQPGKTKSAKKIVGLIAYADARKDFGTYNLIWHAVLKKFRNKGIGTALFKAAHKKVTAIKGAASIELNTTSPKYYKKLGLNKVHKKKDLSSNMLLEW